MDRKSTLLLAISSSSFSFSLRPSGTQGLVIGMALFDVIAAFAFALSVFASKRPLEMAETYILTSFWSTTILSFLAGGVFLWLSWVLRPELDEAERENQRNREEKADEERGLDQLASKVNVLVHVAHRVDSSECSFEGVRYCGIAFSSYTPESLTDLPRHCFSWVFELSSSF